MRKSDLALGSWQFGPSHGFWTDQSQADSRATLKRALHAGIRHYDTAPAYGNGQAEQLLGSVLGTKRSEYIIDTKFMPKQPGMVRKDVQKSLDRLKTSYIDTLYLHWPSSFLDVRPILEEASLLLEEGTVKRLGVSNTPISMVKHFADIPISVLQIPCSLIWSHMLPSYVEFAQERQLKLVGYSPLGLGLLGGNHPDTPQDSRKDLYVFSSQTFPAYQKLRTILSSLAEQKGCSMAQLSLLWARSQGLETILIGSRNPNQLDQLLETNNMNLDEAEKNLLDEHSRLVCKTIPTGQDNLFGHRW